MSAIQSILAGYGGTAAGGGSTPDTIGSGLLIWNQNGVGLWQDLGKTTPAGVSDPVAVWEDQANGNDMTYLTNGGERPIHEAGGAIHFDGGDDILVATSGVTLKPATIFMLFQLDQVGTVQVLIAGDNGLGLTANATALRIDKAGVAVIGTSTHTLTTAATRVIATYDGSGNYEFFVNGSSAGTGTNNQTINSVAVRLGQPSAPAPIDGIVRDWGAYDNVLSGGDITALDDYLASL